MFLRLTNLRVVDLMGAVWIISVHIHRPSAHAQFWDFLGMGDPVYRVKAEWIGAIVAWI